MTRRFSSISTQTTLATSISNSALSLVVATGTASTLLGGVALTAGNVDQFKIIIDPDTASSEICYVTEVTSDTLTIQRGKDGTSAVSHTGGAVIKHVLTGEDLTYFTTGVVPTSNLATGLPFPGSTSGTNTLKAPAVTGTVTNTLPATTGTLMSAESIDAATSKTTPVDADEIPLADSVTSFGLKKLTWANLKATLKTYFDTLYARLNGPTVNNQTASYVLVASDVGKRVVMNAAGATTITVDTSLMGAGDSLDILNIGAGVCTITAGTATVASNASLALAQNAGGKLYFISASSAVFIAGAGAASSSKVVQIVTATYGTYTTSATNSYVDTGLSAAITPTSASNNVLVFLSQNGCYKGTADTWLQLILLRNVTQVGPVFADRAGNGLSTTPINFGSISAEYLDSPAQTASVTYKTQFQSGNNASLVGVQHSAASSTMVLMEVTP